MSQAGHTIEEVKKQSFWDPVDVAEVLYTENDLFMAAFCIQGLYRGTLARMELHERMQWEWSKDYDPYTCRFYYSNRRTGYTTWTKPANLHRTDITSQLEIDAAHTIRGLYLLRRARAIARELILAGLINGHSREQAERMLTIERRLAAIDQQVQAVSRKTEELSVSVERLLAMFEALLQVLTGEHSKENSHHE